MMKIILVGYMGVGKSTIGEILAQKMNLKCLDLDQLIAKNEKLSIKDVFQQKGEIYFRKTEHVEFKKLIDSDESLIISTGGGTPCYSGNHLLLNGDNIISIYLKSSIALIYERLKHGKSERPLVANQSAVELKEFIAKNLFDRSYYYNQATYKVSVDEKSPEMIVDEIMALLN